MGHKKDGDDGLTAVKYAYKLRLGGIFTPITRRIEADDTKAGRIAGYSANQGGNVHAQRIQEVMQIKS